MDLIPHILQCTLLLTCISYTNTAYTYTLEENLRNILLGSYNTFVRPDPNVNVTIGLNLITLNALSVSDQSMSTSGYLTIQWRDQRLDWSGNPTYNTDIPAIYSNEDNVWRPALIIENSVKDISVINDDNVLMHIDKNGDIIWTPPGIYVTNCDTDVTFYPFDTQECDIVVTTWGYTSIEISLLVDTEAVRLSHYKENGEWTYKGFSSSSSSSTREGSSTPQVTFTLKFQRRPYFHLLNTLIPVSLLAVLSAMVFKLPPDSGEKMGFTLTVLLAYAVYLTIISGSMPSTSTSTSILSVYLVIILALGVISVIATIFVLECHHKDNQRPIPKWLQRATKGCLAKFVCWKHYRCVCRKKVGASENKKANFNETDEKDVVKHDKLTWSDICHILDAFFLRLYLIIVGSLTFILLLTLIIAYNAQ